MGRWKEARKGVQLQSICDHGIRFTVWFVPAHEREGGEIPLPFIRSGMSTNFRWVRISLSDNDGARTCDKYQRGIKNNDCGERDHPSHFMHAGRKK